MASGEPFMKIRIENFRSIVALELDLTPGTVGIFAPNGTGKTNVGLALMQLHLGFCSKGDKNFPVDSLVRRGSSGYRIEVKTDLYAISETRKGKTLEVEASWKGKALRGNRSEVRIQLLEKFGLAGLSQTQLRDEWMRTVFVRPASMSILDLEFSKPTEFASYLGSLLGLADIEQAREIIAAELKMQETLFKAEVAPAKIEPVETKVLLKRQKELAELLSGQTRYSGETELEIEHQKRMAWLVTSLQPLRQDSLGLGQVMAQNEKMPVKEAEALRGQLKMLPRAELIPSFKSHIVTLGLRLEKAQRDFRAASAKIQEQRAYLNGYVGNISPAQLEEQTKIYPHYKLKDSTETQLTELREKIAGIIAKYTKEAADVETELAELEPQLDGIEVRPELEIKEDEGAARAELRNAKTQKAVAETNLTQAQSCPVCHSQLLVISGEFVAFDPELAAQQVKEFESRIAELDKKIAGFAEQKQYARMAERIASLRTRIHRIKELETAQLAQLRTSESEVVTFVSQISKGQEYWLKWEAYQKSEELRTNIVMQAEAQEKLESEIKSQIANYEKMIKQAQDSEPEWQKLNAHDTHVTAEKELAKAQKEIAKLTEQIAEEEKQFQEKLAKTRELEPLFCERDALHQKLIAAEAQNTQAKAFSEWEIRTNRMRDFIDIRRQMLPKIKEWMSGKLAERILIFEDVINRVSVELGAPQIRIKQNEEDGKTGCSIVTLTEETSPRWEYSDGQAAVLKTAFALAHRMAFPVKVQHIPFVIFDDPGPAVHRDMQEELYRGLAKALSMPGLKADYLFVASAYENAETLFRPAHVVNL